MRRRKKMKCNRPNESYLITSSRRLDNILGGGLALGNVYEVCGLEGTGKTQFSYQLCVNATLPKLFGGQEGTSLFIDTENNFFPSRVDEVQSHFKKMLLERVSNLLDSKNREDALIKIKEMNISDSIHHISVLSFHELYKLIKQINNIIRTIPNLKLIVIDSLSFPTSCEYSLDSKDRPSALKEIYVHLKRVSEVQNIAIVLTNLVTIVSKTKEVKSALGKAWTRCIGENRFIIESLECMSEATCKRINFKEYAVNIVISDRGIKDLSY
eukprot:maker-scaffold_15-snap-gene-2.29-mRNA-1 protein AED:0.00 eAED:0.00 QI:67/1/1/1/0/0/3/942/268